MAHGFTDGTLIVAQLERGLFGGAVYKHVRIRESDGSVTSLGTLVALDTMRHAMAPGSRGRFYHYRIAGAKGMFGFRPVSGKSLAYFPRRWEAMSLGVGFVNLMLALTWLTYGGRLPLFCAAFGLLGIALGVVFASTRSAAMRTYHADDARAPSLAELRAAGLRLTVSSGAFTTFVDESRSLVS